MDLIPNINQFYKPVQVVLWLVFNLAFWMYLYFNRERVFYILKGVSQPRIILQLAREEKVYTQRVNLSLYLFSVFFLSGFVYISLYPKLFEQENFPLTWFKFSVIFLIVFSGKGWIDWVILKLYEVKEWKTIETIFYYYLSILSIPFSWLMAVLWLTDMQGKWLIFKLFLMLFAIVYAVILFRKLSMFKMLHIPNLIIFLYFCTLEIFPAILLGNWIIKIINIYE